MSPMETYYGLVETSFDVLILFEACRLGLIKQVQRRLSDSERMAIRSGSVFVWDEEQSGMKRWTDGRSWSPSRVQGCFLTYYEWEGRRRATVRQPTTPNSPTTTTAAAAGATGRMFSPAATPNDDHCRYHQPTTPGGIIYPDHTTTSSSSSSSSSSSFGTAYIPRYGQAQRQGATQVQQGCAKENGILKKALSVTTTDGRKLHLIAYYHKEDLNATNSSATRFLTPSSDPALKHIVIPPNMYPEVSPENQSCGNAADSAAAAGSSSPSHILPPYNYPGGGGDNVGNNATTSSTMYGGGGGGSHYAHHHHEKHAPHFCGQKQQQQQHSHGHHHNHHHSSATATSFYGPPSSDLLVGPPPPPSLGNEQLPNPHIRSHSHSSHSSSATVSSHFPYASSSVSPTTISQQRKRHSSDDYWSANSPHKMSFYHPRQDMVVAMGDEPAAYYRKKQCLDSTAALIPSKRFSVPVYDRSSSGTTTTNPISGGGNSGSSSNNSSTVPHFGTAPNVRHNTTHSNNGSGGLRIFSHYSALTPEDSSSSVSVSGAAAAAAAAPNLPPIRHISTSSFSNTCSSLLSSPPPLPPLTAPPGLTNSFSSKFSKKTPFLSPTSLFQNSSSGDKGLFTNNNGSNPSLLHTPRSPETTFTTTLKNGGSEGGRVFGPVEKISGVGSGRTVRKISYPSGLFYPRHHHHHHTPTTPSSSSSATISTAAAAAGGGGGSGSIVDTLYEQESGSGSKIGGSRYSLHRPSNLSILKTPPLLTSSSLSSSAAAAGCYNRQGFDIPTTPNTAPPCSTTSNNIKGNNSGGFALPPLKSAAATTPTFGFYKISSENSSSSGVGGGGGLMVSAKLCNLTATAYSEDRRQIDALNSSIKLK
ncbi:Gluconate transport-inducing protein [Mycoemilia scoparia]|uniref:Gluconate transport-inducing protein n=1 Tax=Mycoemilia scoparia TaxID=417184 RepID=A0A9W8A6T3_9FUNG|nr:Gluconate transport-inducing protein [Mycoemilia scoparia]